MTQLVDHFLENGSEFGLFLNIPRLRHSRPSPALHSALNLWSIHLSRERSLLVHEPDFLTRALALASRGLVDNHPQRLLHTIQAEVLLAYYFFSSGRFLEGKYHTFAAVSLSLSSSLHLIRAAGHPPSSPLPVSKDAIDEGERICAWWTVMVLDRCWSAGLGESPGLSYADSLQIVDTPWPLESEEYPRRIQIPVVSSCNTIQAFIDGEPPSASGMSTMAMLSKAAILWQRADEIARLGWSATTEFHQLDARIDSYRSLLIPPNRLMHPSASMTRTLAVAHSIAHAATIRLHSAVRLSSHAGRNKRLVAARTILGIIAAVALTSFQFINPIMGIIWLEASNLLLEVLTVQIQSRSQGGPPREEELNLRTFLSKAGRAISSFKSNGGLIGSQVEEIEQKLIQVGIYS
ncbi:unnamed protein product [Mycena citricolor]|uniref:Xylanolytic transcriptional activator regulatory domain-containing protein n=1 Tax=Mycena citricolor TaxID=2018698 RepID=A0AAD2HBP3_9AGAR|nr:unnamed protein product [Mycena citricolor]